MRKWMIGFLAVLLLLLGSVYIFIPDIVNLKSGIVINATRPGLHRMLLDKKNVAKWWPGKISNDSFYLNAYSYQINNSNITVLPITINRQNNIVPTSLFLIEAATDLTKLEWIGAMATSYNPVKRFLAYLKAKKLNNDITAVLQKMGAFYSKSENIYGFDIKKELVTDSILIQNSGICKGYPTNPFIYSLVDKLKNYTAVHAAKATGYPMLNIKAIDSLNFEVKVALPIDKMLPNSGGILQKRMLGKGNILVTEVKGGNDITNKAFVQIQKYAEDYQRAAPAIPFYSLITDRLKEPDSSKWVTKIYFPVM
jgi:hypothetical protein